MSASTQPAGRHDESDLDEACAFEELISFRGGESSGGVTWHA